jgi:peptidoglycan/xylan/chitin deacetylase (PgdA/CDA1 family)
MKPRAAVFVFHDVVPPEHLADVPPTHRPYALTPEDFRTLLVVATTTARRAATMSSVPGELGGGFYGLTFDDGAASDYVHVFPALLELKLRATFFVVPTLVGTTGHVTWAQLREMVAAGMEVGSHSLTHPFLNQLDAAGIRREYGESRAMLEDRLGLAIRSASLPRGWEPPGLGPLLSELGYRVFCTSRVGWWHPGDEPLAMPRVAVRHGMGAEEFLAIASAERRSLWRLQVIEAAKNAAKACLGTGAWQRLRAPLLGMRYANGGKA